MKALRIKKRLDSDTLYITGLKEMANKNVEIIILEDSEGENEGSILSTRGPGRKPGSAKGLLSITDDFHKPLDEKEIEDFYK